MRSGCKGAAGAAAIGLFVFSGASASPVYTTVVLDDFEASSEDRRWAAQLGSSGHVVYFADTELRRWINGHTTVLHEIGTHLEGLAPGVTTVIRDEGDARRGKLLGVDRDGGVSVCLNTESDAPQLNNLGLLAMTTPDGGFRAVMAREEVAAPTGVVHSTVTTPPLGLLRSDDGYTIAGGRVNGVITRRIISPGLQHRVLITDGDRTPANDGEILYQGRYYTVNLGVRFGDTMLHDIAPGGVAASYIRYRSDMFSSIQHGVVRDFGGGLETVIRTYTMTGYQLWPSVTQPMIRINASGEVLISANMLDASSGSAPRGEMLAIFRPGELSPDVFAIQNRSIQPTNFPEFQVRHLPNNSIGRRISFGDNGGVIFDLNYSVTGRGSGVGLMHRGPSNQYTMLLAPDAVLLGSPGATVSTVSPAPAVLIASLDASSAAALYNINSTPTIFYATPEGVTRVAAVGESLEVAPGDVRQISGVELLDVNGPRVLFSAEFTDSSRGMFVMNADPGCPADLNNDGVVDADDFFLFLQFFAAGDPRADINGDGVIDADDFFEYLNLFAQGC